MRNTFRLFLTVTALLASAGAAQAQAAAADTVRTDALRPGDVIKLWIWREKDMSGEFQVPENGVVTFPKIGSWTVVQKDPAQLKKELVAEYDKYLRDAAIEITFLRRVNVLGAVNKPGVYPVDETMTVANALALAGGTAPNGKVDEIQLFRNGEKRTTRITQMTRLADLSLRSGDQLYVPERSWAARNTPLLAAVISGLTTVAVALIVKY